MEWGLTKHVRTVIIIIYSFSLKYVQEVGAGRDGRPSQAISLYTDRDLMILNHLANENSLDIDVLNGLKKSIK